MNRLPTVKFDTSRLTHSVLADLERDIKMLPETSEQNFDQLYDLAVRAFAAGGDLHMLSTGIMSIDIDGMTGQRAAEISKRLWFRLRDAIEREQSASLGITHARWMYSNAPCMVDPKSPTAEDLRRDLAHKAADGKTYVVADGLVINGTPTWPGDEEGCRCVSTAVIPGFD